MDLEISNDVLHPRCMGDTNAGVANMALDVLCQFARAVFSLNQQLSLVIPLEREFGSSV